MTILHMVGSRARGGKAKGKPLFQIIQELAMTANLAICLDPGDPASYDGVSQTWIDRNGVSNYFRGTSASAEASDPTFVGAAGGLTDEHFLLDGGDFFAPTASTSYETNWHKEDGQFTIAFMIWLPSNSGGGTFRSLMDNSASSPGMKLQITDSNQLNHRIESYSAYNKYCPTPLSGYLDKWTLIVHSVNEEGGAISFFSLNNNLAYYDADIALANSNSPASNMQIGRQANNVSFLAAGTKVGPIACWNRRITEAEAAALYAGIKPRYP